MAKSPIRFNFLLVLASIICYIIYIHPIQPTENHAKLVQLLFQIFLFSIWSIIGIVSIVFFINTIFNYLKNRNKQINVFYTLNAHELSIAPGQLIPNILGFQYCTIYTVGDKLIESTFLLSQHHLKPLNGGDKELLQNIPVGNFNIQTLQWQQTDIFNLFQITLKFETFFNIIKPPQTLAIEELELPKQAASQDPEQLVSAPPNEGNLSKIKPFESGDDIRRIVWRVFAKDKSIMVRILEMEKAYYQHFKILGIFQNDFISLTNTLSDTALLTSYKNYIWTVYQKVKEDIKQPLIFNADWKRSDTADLQEIEHLITESNWHTNNLTALNVFDHNIFIIPSNINIATLEELGRQKNACFIFIRLAIPKQAASRINFTSLFIKSTKEEISFYKNSRSSLNKQLLANEERIIQFLEGRLHVIIPAFQSK